MSSHIKKKCIFFIVLRDPLSGHKPPVEKLSASEPDAARKLDDGHGRRGRLVTRDGRSE